MKHSNAASPLSRKDVELGVPQSAKAGLYILALSVEAAVEPGAGSL